MHQKYKSRSLLKLKVCLLTFKTKYLKVNFDKFILNINLKKKKKKEKILKYLKL